MEAKHVFIGDDDEVVAFLFLDWSTVAACCFLLFHSVLFSLW